MNMDTTEPGPRRRTPDRRPHAPRPLPRLPRGMRRFDLAWGRPVAADRGPVGLDDDDERAAVAWLPLNPETLTPEAVSRLLARAEYHGRRVQAAHRAEESPRYWLRAELRLALARAHPAIVARWLTRVRYAREAAERRLADWRDLETELQAHEPARRSWLRAQLATLTLPPDGTG